MKSATPPKVISIIEGGIVFVYPPADVDKCVDLKRRTVASNATNNIPMIVLHAA
jgi:hypothetical protein